MNGDLEIRGYTVAQFPNAPLIAALLALVTSRFLESGSTEWALARAVFYVGITAWAWWELTDGVNGFRRVLGAGGLVFVVVSMADQIR